MEALSRVSPALTHLHKDTPSQKHTGPNASHHAVVGSSPVDVQALQQNLGDGKILCCSVVRDIQAFSEFSHRLLPLSFPKQGVALFEEVAYQLGQEVLGRGRKMGVRLYLCIPKSVTLICPVQHKPVTFFFGAPRMIFLFSA